jgi:hypothetical protein
VLQNGTYSNVRNVYRSRLKFMNWMCVLLECVVFFSFLLDSSYTQEVPNFWKFVQWRGMGCGIQRPAQKFLMIILSDKWNLHISFLQPVFSSGFLIKKLMDPNISSFSFWHIVGPTWTHHSPMGTHNYVWMLFVVVIVSHMYG